MDEVKVFLGPDLTTNIVCPSCRKGKLTNLSRYKNIEQTTHFRVKCPCSHLFLVRVERRKYYRKEVDLRGRYSTGKSRFKSPMKVKDISRYGLKFETYAKPLLSIGDEVEVEFTLDDTHKTFVEKHAVVRTIFDNSIGCEFLKMTDVDIEDRRLGFYLMS